MRIEVLILLSLVLAFIITWLFIPAWSIKGPNYYLRLMPWGFVVTFFGVTYIVPPPTVYLVPFFALDSALVPLIWRRSVYSLYLSALLITLALTMFADTVLFQERYMQVKGYLIEPTPNGYLYVALPHSPAFGIPGYILAMSAAVAILNMVTRARWIKYRAWSLAQTLAEYGPLMTVEQALKRLNIPYVKAQGTIIVGNLVIREADGKLALSLIDAANKPLGEVAPVEVGLLMPPNEAIAYVIHEAVKRVFEEKVTVIEYAEED
ncbi:hypothetical protein [Caldivirga sp. UBA161]|uniref:hypothetical protein n=1 Tax=Caldivirga sp. UBA161 TaxID=1915569 RepID=UPI0025B9B93D|nr:hypothetical protein [Caldivirga sp. UBA161]